VRWSAILAAVLACGCNQLLGIHGFGSGHGNPDGTADALPAGDWAYVAVDSGSTCGLRTDGSLWCWGAQPVITANDETVPTELSSAHWLSVSGNGGLACGLQSDSSLWCWGEGALGNGSQGESSTPLEISSEVWQSVTVADNDACAIRADGTLWCWGFSYLGNLGSITSPSGPEGYVLTPTQLDTNTYLAVDLDGDTLCGLRADQSVWCSGDLRFAGSDSYPNDTMTMIASGWTTLSMSFDGACGVTPGGIADCLLQSPIPAAVDDRTDWTQIVIRGGICGLHHDGTLDCWNGVEGPAAGSATTPTQITGGPETWTRFALAPDHLCGIGSDANLWCIGNQASGQLGNGVGPHLTPTRLPGTWSSVLAWIEGTCAIDMAGSASCWGTMIGDGTLDIHQTPTPIGAWTAFSAGFGTLCGIRDAGTMFCWGENFNGELGNGTQTESLTPTLVTGDLTWSAVSVGFGGAGDEGTTCGIATTGAAYCWGQNANGQLGDGSFGNSSATPVAVALGKTATAIATGGDFACAIASDGTTSCWGANEYGELDRSGSDQASPVAVSSSFRQVAAGEESACAVTTAGSATCWGDPSFAPTGSTWTQLSTTDGGTICGVQADGSLWCWGANSSGQFGNATLLSSATPTQLPGATTWAQVSSGGAHTCAIDTDHGLWCWGDNSEGEIGDGTAIAATFQLVPR
jgi:alpha-tubulin suppressor-like RCC1 family protein